MLLRLAVRYVLRTVAVLTLGASFAGGCSRQGEGERCDYVKAGGDSDCDSGLVCKRCNDLQDGTTDRCCPPGNTFSDSRCQPGTTASCQSDVVGTGGNTGTAGSSSAGTGATSGGGSGGTESGGTGGTDSAGTGGTESGGSAGADTAGQAGDTQAGG